MTDLLHIAASEITAVVDSTRGGHILNQANSPSFDVSEDDAIPLEQNPVDASKAKRQVAKNLKKDHDRNLSFKSNPTQRFTQSQSGAEEKPGQKASNRLSTSPQQMTAAVRNEEGILKYG